MPPQGPAFNLDAANALWHALHRYPPQPDNDTLDDESRAVAHYWAVQEAGYLLPANLASLLAAHPCAGTAQTSAQPSLAAAVANGAAPAPHVQGGMAIFMQDGPISTTIQGQHGLQVTADLCIAAGDLDPTHPSAANCDAVSMYSLRQPTAYIAVRVIKRRVRMAGKRLYQRVIAALPKFRYVACDPSQDVQLFEVGGFIPKMLLLAIVLTDAARTLRRRPWPTGSKSLINYFILLFLHEHGPDE
jgi:hypothetical protein